MLENLINLVKEHAGDAIIKNPAIPNQHNDSAIESVANSIFSAIKSQMASGGLSRITSLFSGSDQKIGTQVTEGATNDVITNLVSKLGISQEQARDVATKVVPNVMTNLVNKTNDPNDSSFDLNSIIKSVSGEGGLLNKLKNLF